LQVSNRHLPPDEAMQLEALAKSSLSQAAAAGTSASRLSMSLQQQLSSLTVDMSTKASSNPTKANNLKSGRPLIVEVDDHPRHAAVPSQGIVDVGVE
jgi:hypothetical protein